jgi:hypothetical protein
VFNGVTVRYFSDNPEGENFIASAKELGPGLTYLMLCHELNKLDSKPASLFCRGAELNLMLSLDGRNYEVHLLMHHTGEMINRRINVALFDQKRPLLMFKRGSAADQLIQSFAHALPAIQWSTPSEVLSKLQKFISGQILKFNVLASAKKTPFRPVFYRTRCSSCGEIYLIPVAVTLLVNRVVPTLSPISFHVGMCRRRDVAGILPMFDWALHNEAKRYGFVMASFSEVYSSPGGRFMRDSTCPNCNSDIRKPIEPPEGVLLKLCPAEIAHAYVDASPLLMDSVIWSEPEFTEEQVMTTSQWKACFVEQITQKAKAHSHTVT